ncbi:hypothetical protein XacyCFBP1159_10055 [Xanthomonas arboricola pv. corylina]|nr:hypothetical protein XacyCFBP1159_10055 [Xanthomonas arboricola pv. corylina]
MRAWMQAMPSMPSMRAPESALLLFLSLFQSLSLLQRPTPSQSQHPKPPEPPPSTTQSFASPCTLPGW